LNDVGAIDASFAEREAPGSKERAIASAIVRREEGLHGGAEHVPHNGQAQLLELVPAEEMKIESDGWRH
jgi:hypothetical protein